MYIQCLVERRHFSAAFTVRAMGEKLRVALMGFEREHPPSIMKRYKSKRDLPDIPSTLITGCDKPYDFTYPPSVYIFPCVPINSEMISLMRFNAPPDATKKGPGHFLGPDWEESAKNAINTPKEGHKRIFTTITA
ncbi:hypothetical protein CEXT_342791 [Caerostris extrusa]|uniref:Uncharacterized protein n=1 Tax=Caerostris extrusa TaxID=172846 RepID=A0AAV4PGY6_CAEEX|nr:hypothetical protein CEXT_342791 [Caerostris extrusa]